VSGVRDADAAGVGEALQSRRDVHPVTIDLLALDHDVAEVHANAKRHPSLGRKARVLGLKSSLNIDGAVHRLDHAGELGQHTVASRIDEASVMLAYLRIN
jgi:hypothetical protein